MCGHQNKISVSCVKKKCTKRCVDVLRVAVFVAYSNAVNQSENTQTLARYNIIYIYRRGISKPI